MVYFELEYFDPIGTEPWTVEEHFKWHCKM